MKSLYFYIDTARIALQSIFAHKLRTFLTLIGIIIGVASVVVVGASIEGFETYVLERVSKMLGMNHFMIARIAKVGGLSDEEWERMNRRNKRLEWDDYEWLQYQCQTCQEVGAQANNRVDINHDGQQLLGTMVAGVTANLVQIEDKTIAEGRFLLPFEVEHSAMVCVLGMDVREKFFAGIDPIGKTIKVSGMPMRVVGVEEKRGSMFGNSLDNNIYIPLTTYGSIF